MGFQLETHAYREWLWALVIHIYYRISIVMVIKLLNCSCQITVLLYAVFTVYVVHSVYD